MPPWDVPLVSRRSVQKIRRVIRALKLQGHGVYGLTSNGLDGVHAPEILETLSKYRIR